MSEIKLESIDPKVKATLPEPCPPDRLISEDHCVNCGHLYNEHLVGCSTVQTGECRNCKCHDPETASRERLWEEWNALNASPSRESALEPDRQELLRRIDDLKLRNHILRDRTDLPDEWFAKRMGWYQKVQALEQRLAVMTDALDEVFGCIKAAAFEGLSEKIALLPNADLLKDIYIRRVLPIKDIATEALAESDRIAQTEVKGDNDEK